MMFFVGLIGAPIAYFIVLVNLFVQKDRKGIGVSLIFAALAAGTAYWSIAQSKSSTAGIGILGLPLMLALGGFLGLAFGRWRSSTHGGRSVGALLSLGGAVLLIAFNLRAGWKTIGKNQVNEVKQAAHSAEVDRDRALVAAGLAKNENRQRAYLDSSIRARMNDRAFLIAALENDSVSPAILDTLANSADLGIALQVVRNGSTSGATLARVYRTSSYPNYFFQALAENPRTPRDILDKISKTSKEPTVINALLQNPSFKPRRR